MLKAFQPSEVIVSIEVPLCEPLEHTGAYKQSLRREDDIAIVNGAFWLQTNDENFIVDARIAFGGIAAVPRLAHNTARRLEGM